MAVFQRETETLLAGVPQTAIFLDDICVTGRTPTEHLANVREVFRRLAAAGLKINPGRQSGWLTRYSAWVIKSPLQASDRQLRR